MKNSKLLSVVIIAKDEENMLPGCLKTVGWAGIPSHASEVLVIDTGSADKTVQIAKRFGARVFEYSKGKHYSDWRNKGLKEALGEWILYIDADERMPVALKREILSVVRISSKLTNAYALPRRNIVLGKELKRGGMWPDYQKRLFRKTALKKWTGEVHEEPVFDGKLEHLKNPLVHQKHESIAEMVDKTNHWSEIEAKLMFTAGHPPMNIPRFVSVMMREFWKRMVVQKAFLDGKVGIIYALYQVFSRFTSYAKLWEMQLASERVKE